MKLIVREDPLSNSVNLWLFKDMENGRCLVVNPVAMETTEHGEAFHLPEPTFKLKRSEAQTICQSLINELTQLGYRANTDKISGKLEAQTEHLKDLQKIVNVLLSGAIK